MVSQFAVQIPGGNIKGANKEIVLRKKVVGSMNESTIGTAAIAHLLPLLDYVDMDGPLLLAEDIATGVSFDHGKVQVSKHPGLGIELTNSLHFQ